MNFVLVFENLMNQLFLADKIGDEDLKWRPGMFLPRHGYHVYDSNIDNNMESSLDEMNREEEFSSFVGGIEDEVERQLEGLSGRKRAMMYQEIMKKNKYHF